MTIVFYSTAASRFDAAAVSLTTYPRRAAVWAELAERWPEHDFCVVTQRPAQFLLDDGGAVPAEVCFLHPRVRAVVLPEDADAACAASRILAEKPALAIAATGWAPPYDWLGVQDSLVADLLRASGVRVLAHPVSLSLDCFDKSRTHALLSRLGFAMPRAVYVHHELYWAERRHHELTRNVYKDAVLAQIRALRYPVVIKDTVGLSSYSMEVAVSYRQALAYLNSGRTKVDRLVEEYVEGEQAGAEIYADGEGAAAVLPPLFFSLNRYGLTSPKQSVKLGAVTDADTGSRFRIDDLRRRLGELSRAAGFSGPAQVDLVFSAAEKRWYVIEINPRLSGMSETYAASLGISLPEMLLRTALGQLPASDALPYRVLNIKLPLLSVERCASLASEPCVVYLHQIENHAAKQERERGYCELVLRARSLPALMASLDDLAARHAGCMESAFVEKARALSAKLSS